METRVWTCERTDEWTNASSAAPRTQSLLLLVSYWECSPAVAYGTHRNARRSRKTTRRSRTRMQISRIVVLGVYALSVAQFPKSCKAERWRNGMSCEQCHQYERETERGRERLIKNVFFFHLLIHDNSKLLATHLYYLVYIRLAELNIKKKYKIKYNFYEINAIPTLFFKIILKYLKLFFINLL